MNYFGIRLYLKIGLFPQFSGCSGRENKTINNRLPLGLTTK